ncbi:prepilin-type N-terminal cleavage/methylation domain-containing protein [Lysobacter sp. 2RAF19]
MRARRASGFTLVELIVATTVFAILAMVAVPAFTTYFEKTRLRGAADAVVALIAEARLASVKQARTVSVRMSGLGAQWCAGAREAPLPLVGMPMAGGDVCDCVAGDGCVVEGRRAVVSAQTYAGVVSSSAVDAFAFEGGTGMRIGEMREAVRLASRSGRFALRIVVSPLGHASVCSDGDAIAGVRSC